MRIIGLEPTRQNPHFGNFWQVLTTLQKRTLVAINSTDTEVYDNQKLIE